MYHVVKRSGISWKYQWHTCGCDRALWRVVGSWQSDGEEGEGVWAMGAEEAEALCTLSGQPERCMWGSWASLPAGVQTASGEPPRQYAYRHARPPDCTR